MIVGENVNACFEIILDFSMYWWTTMYTRVEM